MSTITTNIKKINFMTSAITIFAPDGRVISIQKIKKLNYHIEYLTILAKSNPEIKKLLENIDFKYYLVHPAEAINDIIPIFAKNNYSICINITPNITDPTNLAVMFLYLKALKTSLTNAKSNYHLFNF